MSRDAKNSIMLWAGAIWAFGLAWAAMHFDLLGWVPDRWMGPILGILLAMNIATSVWRYLRKRRG